MPNPRIKWDVPRRWLPRFDFLSFRSTFSKLIQRCFARILRLSQAIVVVLCSYNFT
jgi:hypothetical protein